MCTAPLSRKDGAQKSGIPRSSQTPTVAVDVFTDERVLAASNYVLADPSTRPDGTPCRVAFTFGQMIRSAITATSSAGPSGDSPAITSRIWRTGAAAGACRVATIAPLMSVSPESSCRAVGVIEAPSEHRISRCPGCRRRSWRRRSARAPMIPAGPGFGSRAAELSRRPTRARASRTAGEKSARGCRSPA